MVRRTNVCVCAREGVDGGRMEDGVGEETGGHGADRSSKKWRRERMNVKRYVAFDCSEG